MRPYTNGYLDLNRQKMKAAVDKFALGDVVIQGGQTLRNAFLAYKTYGQLSSAKDNVIVYPTV